MSIGGIAKINFFSKILFMNCDFSDISAFIFDMDGVLLDTERLCKICWQKAALDFELKNVDKVFYKCVGQARQDTFVTLYEYFKNQKDDFDPQKFYFHAVEYFKNYIRENGVPVKKGAIECLKRFSRQGIPLALASSTREEAVRAQLTETKMIGFFKTLTCGDSVKHSKPDPEIYLNACRSLGFPPEKCCAVEDSPNGIKSACNAGMKVIMVVDQIQPTLAIKKMCIKIVKSLDEI